MIQSTEKEEIMGRIRDLEIQNKALKEHGDSLAQEIASLGEENHNLQIRNRELLDKIERQAERITLLS